MADERLHRRLAAILSADVVGYSRLMGLDEAGTFARLKAIRREVTDPMIAAHSGRIFKIMGDGMLVEFASVVDAVGCAIDIQRKVWELESSSANPIQFRIGINLGDIIIEGEDIYGDGVNIAARIESIAAAGGVAISEDALRQVRGKVEANFVDIGEQSLKNIARPIRVYRLEAGEVQSASAGSPTLSLPEKPSIAVLPFQNMSGDSEQEYFVDGIVEDIITGLSRIRWLFVISRNSTFVYKGRSVDAKQVGRELGVRYVLEGSLRKSGNRVRITGQLIEATTGTHLWAQRYDRDLADIFEVQDDITLSVVGAIEPSLRQAEIDRARRKRPDNLDAYDLYLRALPYLHASMPGDADKALALLRQALALQPDYPAANAKAALCYENRYMRGGLQLADKTAALRHARIAIEAGADDADTLATAGFVIGLVEHDYETAMNVIDRALLLNGSSAYALGSAAIILGHAGQTVRSIEYGERALRVSPLDPEIHHPYIGLGIAHCAAGNWQEAIVACRIAAQANPRFSLPHVLQAAALCRLGRLQEAESAARWVLECEPDFSVSGFVRAHTGRTDIWQPIAEALRKIGLPK